MEEISIDIQNNINLSSSVSNLTIDSSVDDLNSIRSLNVDQESNAGSIATTTTNVADNNKSNIKEYMELDPELYGLRRSGRNPKPIVNPFEDVEEDYLRDSKRRTSRTLKKSKSSKSKSEYSSSNDDFDDDDDDNNNESDFSDYGSKKRTNRSKRSKSRRSRKNRSSSSEDDGRNPYLNENEDEDESSESDFEQSNKSYKRKTKRKSRKVPYIEDDDDDLDSSAGGNRWSSRHKTKINYDEDTLTDFEEDSEAGWDDDEEEEVDPRIIDRFITRRIIKRKDISNSEDEEDEEERLDSGEEIEQVQIKWKDRSYRELEWHNLENLRYIRGFGKYKRFQEDQERFALIDSDLIEEEEKERLALELDEVLETIKDHTIIDRVIAVRTVDIDEYGDDTQYLCKWKRLGYDDCTWENANNLIDDQDAIDNFLARNSSTCVPRKAKKYTINRRPPYRLFREQPKYLVGGTLRDFQIAGVNWMAEQWHNGRNGILADEMGLGKTVQTVSFLSYLHHHLQLYGPFLVIVPLGTIGAWQKEFAKWAPDMNVIVYQGGPTARPMIRQYEFYSKGNIKFNVLLTTYEMITLDKAYLARPKWAFMAIDEAHRLKNEESKLHKTLIEDYNLDGKLLITGTPLQNNVQELLSLIKFLMPETIEGKEFDISIEDGDDESSKEQIKQLQEILNKVMLRRLKQDVEQSLPPKTELILRVPMSAMQKKYYTAIYTKEFSALKAASSDNSPNNGKTISLQNIVIQLKKVSDHPYLFPNAEVKGLSKDEMLRNLVINSGKMTLLDQLLTRCKEEGHRVLIFSQMVKMLDILQEYVNYRGYRYQRLDGTIPSEARKRAMEKFNMPGSPDFIFLLSTRAGGLGLNLETADTVILFDLDWNPQNDLQAIARAHRIGQKNAVKVYRFVTAGSIEEDIVERCKRKMVLGYAIIENLENSRQRMEELSKKGKKGKRAILDEDPSTKPDKDELEVILKFGAQKLFSGENNSDETNQNALETLNLDSILAGAEETELTATGGGKSSGSEEFMARWNAVNIEVNQLEWDSIVSVNDDKLKEAETLLADPVAEKRIAAELENAKQEPKKDEKPTKTRTRVKKKVVKKETDNESDLLLSDDSDAANDPKVLTKSNIKELTILLQQWGDSEIFFDKLMESARRSLKSKDKQFIKSKIKALIDECENAVVEYVKSMEGQKIPKGTQAKAVYATFEGLSEINARKLLERIYQMRVIAKYLGKTNNIENFRLKHTELESTSRWDTPWGIRDDSMLLIGTFKHGFGNWKQVESDSSLNMANKFFLSSDKDDAKKKPKKPHLDRRVGMLIKILDPERAANGWLPESISLNDNDNASEITVSKRGRNSTATLPGDDGDEPAPKIKKARSSSNDKSHRKSVKSERTELSSKSNESTPQNIEDKDFKFSYDDDARQTCKELLRPIRGLLRKLKGNEGDKELPESEQRKIISQLVTDQFLLVGRKIHEVVKHEHGGRVLEAQLFSYLADEYFLTNIQKKIPWFACKKAWSVVQEKAKKGLISSNPPTPQNERPPVMNSNNSNSNNSNHNAGNSNNYNNNRHSHNTNYHQQNDKDAFKSNNNRFNRYGTNNNGNNHRSHNLHSPYNKNDRVGHSSLPNHHHNNNSGNRDRDRDVKPWEVASNRNNNNNNPHNYNRFHNKGGREHNNNDHYRNNNPGGNYDNRSPGMNRNNYNSHDPSFNNNYQSGSYNNNNAHNQNSNNGNHNNNNNNNNNGNHNNNDNYKKYKIPKRDAPY